MRRALLILVGACKLHAEPGTTSDGGMIAGTTTCATAIATGSEHACAVRDDGSVWCWGRNDFGQVGDGTTTDRVSPMQVHGVANAKQVVAGDTHSCAIDATGAVFCWGHNASGQLGDGSTTDSKEATKVTGITGATALGTGYQHTCALVGDGVQCWGGNTAGELGDGTFTQRSNPQPVPAVASGVIEIGSQDQTVCAVKTDGTVWCWGENYFGELGTGTPSNPNPTPAAIPTITGALHVGLMEQAGCAVTATGTMCWGHNQHGELGTGNNPDEIRAPTATQVPATLVALQGGDTHICGHDAAGIAWCWGNGNDGRLFDEQDRIEPVPQRTELAAVTAVATGYAFSCALLADKGIACAGYNARGQLGDGMRTTQQAPVATAGLTGVTQVYAGGPHTCALVGSTVQCWGANYNGQLGDGTNTPRGTPAPVPGLTDIAQVSTGEQTTCALTTAGAVWCWGANYYGQLGINSDSDAYAPAKMLLPMPAKQVSASDTHTCALLVNGTIMCAGHNPYGELGIGTTDDSAMPVAVMGITTATQIVAGYSHTCAILADKTVKCWGYPGETGTNAMANVLTPAALT
ncbi:MAG TPA: hypothetical protein VGC41_06540, partial [Kofleriaceae bacterium]